MIDMTIMKILIILAILIAIVLAVMVYVYLDYRRHKKPLLSVDPNVNYSLFHHIAVVTIPIFRYQILMDKHFVYLAEVPEQPFKVNFFIDIKKILIDSKSY